MGLTYNDLLFSKKNLSLSNLNEAEKAIKKLREASSSEDALNAKRELLSIYERGALAIRYDLQEHEIESGNFYKNEMLECTKDIPIKIINTEDAFIVKTPITIKRKNKDYSQANSETYYLAEYVRAAIKNWKRENHIGDIDLLKKFDKDKFNLVFIIIRKATKFNRNLHCDNDNLENNLIQNEICSELAIGDSCNYLDNLYSCFRITKDKEEEGTEFILTALKNLSKYTPKQP